MLLIIILGVIAKLALVSGQCNDGIPTVNNFDYPKLCIAWATGCWIIHLRSNFSLFDTLDCPLAIYAFPVGRTSDLKIQAYNTIINSTVTFNGTGTNWDKTGLDEYFPAMPLFSGHYKIVAVDYSRYIVSKFCFLPLNRDFIYVSYRCEEPEPNTEEVTKVLEKNKIDPNQLVKPSANHCPQFVSSTEGGSSTETVE